MADPGTSISENFKAFLKNIAIDNHATIELRYGEVTRALNQQFRSHDSRTLNSLQVGSYGRWTGIKGVSDLDMLYIMPNSSWENYKKDGPYALLQDARNAIANRYPTTKVKVDRLVVCVQYANFHIEVQPVFEDTDNLCFWYPDTYNNGCWKKTKPRQEMDAVQKLNGATNRNLRRLCKMVRAWRNKHGVAMGGLLIDTLCYNFLNQTDYYNDKSYLYYDYLLRDFFKYIKDLPDQMHFAAPGSRQNVKVKKKFKKQAKKAHGFCEDAISFDGKAIMHKKWRKLLGGAFPAGSVELAKREIIYEGNYSAQNTEQFIEDIFPVDIRFPIKIECEITQPGFQTRLLRDMLKSFLWLPVSRSLRFYIDSDGIVDHNGNRIPYKLYWKVLNRGATAIRRDCIRGQIVLDSGRRERTESTSFFGDHVVDCYAVVDGVVVAANRVHVPIEDMKK